MIRWAAPVIVAVAAGAMAIIAAEALLRLFPTRLTYTYTRSIVQDRCGRPDPLLDFSNRPGYIGTFRNREFATAVRISRHALRDADVTYARTPGRERWLVVGDSYAFGWGVEEPETFSTTLEQLVPRLDVVNAACSGWSTRQEVSFLDREGLRYAPDVVLLCFSDNDPYENPLHFRFRGGELREAAAPEGRWSRLKRAILRTSRVADVLAQTRVSRTPLAPSKRHQLWNAETVQIRRALTLCTGHHARLAVLYDAPKGPGGLPHHGEWFAALAATCRALGIPLVDPTAAMLRANRAAPVFFRLDEHWTRAGHAAVARQLAEWWLSGPRLPDRVDVDATRR